MRTLHATDRVVESRTVQILYICLVLFLWFSWFNGSWVKESISWTSSGVIRRYNYWDWRPVTPMLAFTAFSLIGYGAYRLKKWNVRLYGLVIAVVGLLSGAIVLKILSFDELSYWLALLGAAAVVVRGLEYYEKSN